jgi:CubicO group peptidase (beta-lactamase class C family)
LPPVAELDLQRTVAALKQGQADGFHVGALLHASVEGRGAATINLGLASPDVSMRPDTLMPWFSCTKLVTAIAVAIQWERGEVDLDDPVGAHIQSFSGAGRDGITVRHLLTHTAGLRPGDGTARAMRDESWEDAVARVVSTTPEEGWEPGERAGYHLRGTFLLLGEIVRLTSGRPFTEFVGQEIFEPLGMSDSWLAMPTDRIRSYGERVGVMYDTTKEPRPIAVFADEGPYAKPHPAASGVGPIGDLARLAELLLGRGGLGDARVLEPQTVEAMVARHRVGLMDETFGAKIDWGLGVMVNSWYYRRQPAPYGYGDHASMRAFGHGGSQSSLCFADPEHGLAAALICNGMPGEPGHHRRTQPVLSALYEDLGLARKAGTL